MDCTILQREGKDPRHKWRQYLVVWDGCVAVVHMVPALYGWNIGQIDIQRGDWPGMTREQILAWKRETDDGYTSSEATLDDDFRALLLSRIAR